MKRGILSCILFCAQIAVVCAAAPAAKAQEAATPASRSQSEPAGEQAPQKASGIIPPGVKLDAQMPAAGAPRPFEFPKATSKTLSNGLRVFVVTDHREPAVVARLVLMSAGSVKDSSSAPGVAQMTANLLTQGTEKRSAREIAETIDFVGGTLQAAAGRDATTVTLEVVKKDVGVGMDLMADVVLHPAFAAEEIERQRQQLLSNLQVQYSDPDYLATLVLGRTLYGGSGYGLPEEGTPATVKKFKRDDFIKFHDANYAPNETLFGFAGDITADEAFAIAEKYFGLWQKVNVAASAPVQTASASGQHVWLIDKPDAVQTQIRVGKLSIRRADPDYLPLDVSNHIFGGSYNSRLNTEVRIKKGLTYGATSSLNAHRYAGSLSVNTFTRTEGTVEATKLVMSLLAGMANGEINQKELDFARDFLAGVYPISSETAEQVADRVLTVAAFDLPADYNQTYPAKIRATSLEEVQATARKYFTGKDLDIVLAGNISAFRDSLKKEFPDATYAEIPFDQIDVIAPDLRAARTLPHPRAEPGPARAGKTDSAGGSAGLRWRCPQDRHDAWHHRERQDSQSKWRSASQSELAGCVSRSLLRRSESRFRHDPSGLRRNVLLVEVSEWRSGYHGRERRIQTRYLALRRRVGNLSASASRKHQRSSHRGRTDRRQEDIRRRGAIAFCTDQALFRSGYASPRCRTLPI